MIAASSDAGGPHLGCSNQAPGRTHVPLAEESADHPFAIGVPAPRLETFRISRQGRAASIRSRGSRGFARRRATARAISYEHTWPSQFSDATAVSLSTQDLRAACLT